MQKEVTITMTNTMEATPIAHLVQLANQFSSSVYFEMGEVKVNAKSIMGMMSLVLAAGSEVVINADGEDEEKAIEALSAFLTK